MVTITVNKIKGYNKILEMLKDGFDIEFNMIDERVYIQKGNLRYPVRYDTFTKLLKNKKIIAYKMNGLCLEYYKLKEVA